MFFSLFQINANNRNSEKANISHNLNSVTIEKAFVQQQVQGTVTDANGAPIPGVNVIEKGTSNGAATDFDGKWKFDNLFPVDLKLGKMMIEVTDGKTREITPTRLMCSWYYVLVVTVPVQPCTPHSTLSHVSALTRRTMVLRTT